MHLLINFSGCARESPHGLGRQILSNTILCKNLPQPIIFNAAKSVLLPFSGISLECALKSHSSQECNLQCTRKYTRNHSKLLETTYFMLFLKNLTKNSEKKLLIKFVLIEQINFRNICFFCMLHLLLLGKNPKPCMAYKKLCL